MSHAKAIVELSATASCHFTRRLAILDTRSSKGPGGPIDEVRYAVMGSSASPVWIKVASLKPWIEKGKVIS